jgi:molybdopterin converting factor small subunit
MAHIELKLFATLTARAPANAERYPIGDGKTIQDLIGELKLSPLEAKLIFVDGVRAELATVLRGGERVGIFPPVGGG